jgi:NAD-dependent DNA ligase
MKSAEIAALVARLEAAAYAYHNGLEPLMTDEEYDNAIDLLRENAPDHPFLEQVGAAPNSPDEVDLPVPLPSLDKTKSTDTSFSKWLAKNPAAEYHLSAKLDGVSALWYPHTKKLYTRGDGMRGRNISAFVPHLQGLATTGTATAIRGELIIPTASPVIPAGKLARNIVAGALNRDVKAPSAVDLELFHEIHFIAYEVIQPNDLTPSDAYKLLRTAGFEAARATVVTPDKMTPASLSAIFTQAEAKSPYQMDGLVLAPNTPRHISWAPATRKGKAVNPNDRAAWKERLTKSTAMTTVTSVEWNVSAGGLLIPRVLFDTVTLSGANIGAATGLHGRWIYENGVGPGAKIEVRRAGDVIPQIVAVHVVAPGGPAMPAAFIWDGDAATAVHIKPAGSEHAAAEDCIKITHALATLGAENVGPGVVARLYAAGFTTVGAILQASPADFATVEGYHGRMAERIWTGLRVGQASWTPLKVMVASSTMPRGVGHSKLETLFSINPNPPTWSVAEFTAAKPAGLSNATIQAIVASVPAYLEWFTANFQGVAQFQQAPAPVLAPAAVADAMTVVLTGFRDKELEAQLKAAGHTVGDSVTKKTTHLVHPDGPTPTTGKAAKAHEYGASVMSLSAFRALLE